MLNSYLMLLQLLQAFHNGTSVEKTAKDTVNMIINSMILQQDIHTIIFYGELIDVKDYITVGDGIPKVVISSPEYVFEFYENAGFNKQMVFIAVGNIIRKTIRPQIWESFRNVQGYTRSMFIISPEYKVKKTDLKEHFDWCWRKGFSNAIVLEKQNSTIPAFKAYAYVAFPNVSLIELPIRKETDYFFNKLSNFHGNSIISPLQNDPPRVFSHNGKHHGYALKLLLEFLEIRNGKFSPICTEKIYNIRDIIEQIKEGKLLFSVHTFYPVPGVHISYPLRMTKWRLMVPSQGEVFLYYYYIYPFQLELWLMLGVTICLLSCVIVCWHLIPRPKNYRVDFSAAILFVLRLVTNQATPMYNLSVLLTPYAILLMLTIIFGFSLVNLYLVNLTSFFTTTLWNKQLNTLQDVVEANLSVHVEAFERHVIKENYGLPKGFVDLLVPDTIENIINDVINLTTGRAYAAREDLLLFSLSQFYLNSHSPFRFAEEYITTLPVGFVLPAHSQFEISLNMFIMRCDGAGLISKWVTEATMEGFRTGILKLQKIPSVAPVPLTMETFTFAWMILKFGWTVSTFVFLIERIFARLSKIRLQVHYQ